MSEGQELPVVSYSCVQRKWTLEHELWVQGRGWAMRIPAGFSFDLASVPRLVWWLIAPFELSLVAPAAHDWLYTHQGCVPSGSLIPPRTFTRRESDQLFRILMQRERVTRWRWIAAYWAVRVFGWWPWRQAGKRP